MALCIPSSVERMETRRRVPSGTQATMRDVFPDKWLLCLCFNHDCKVRRVIRVGVSSGTV